MGSLVLLTRALPFKDALFDNVASMAALEFIPDPAVAVQEMVRCARPGGSILIGTLNRLAPINQDRLLKGEQPYASGHLFSPDELVKLLSPWGGTRMVASLPGSHAPRPRAVTAGHQPIPQGCLDGPFIIAEVRR
jgi:SAM-dependent methyltransferase